MNRAQRRAARRAGVAEDAITYADAYCCLDCSSDAELTRDALGICHLTIRHDDSCPTYQEATR